MNNSRDYETGKIIEVERRGTGKRKQIKAMSHLMQESQLKNQEVDLQKKQPIIAPVLKTQQSNGLTYLIKTEEIK